MAKSKIPITVAEGDGIGPEIMAAVLHVLDAAQVPLEIQKVEIGEKLYLKGHPTGIEDATWDVIRASKAFLKAPITTPQGGGYKSLNVTIRTTLGLYANVRPCVAYAPFVATKHPNMDVVIVRENAEDLYTGIEYHQTPQTYHALKVISQPGCEKIIRYAFEYARTNERKKVTCFSKDNILKQTDGQFHKIFDEIAKEYPDIQNEHWIVDIGAAKLADTPTSFDVVVMANLYGDILSDVAAQIAGSVGLAGSANIGEGCAMFEAIHGSAPRRAGQNLANPSGLLLAAVMMLVHLGLHEKAEQIHNAWLCTLEDGIHTYDIFKQKISKQSVGTQQFASAIVERLGQKPHTLKAVHYAKKSSGKNIQTSHPASAQKRILVGVDAYVYFDGPVSKLHQMLSKIKNSHLKLTLIRNRGVQVWPNTAPETHCVDSWSCRFLADGSINHKEIAQLLHTLAENNIDYTQAELLFKFDDKPGYS